MVGTQNPMTPADMAAVLGNHGYYGGGYGYPMVPMVYPQMGAGYGDGLGMGSGWIVLILLAALGFGNGGFGFGGGMGGMWPWMMMQGNSNTNNDVQRGFDQLATTNGINNLQAAVANGFATAEVAGCNRAMDNMAMGYQGQINAMQRSFDAQTAIDQRLDAISAQQQVCCCENRAAIQDVKYAIATEGANTRAQSTADTQRVMDKLCQLELDVYKRAGEEKDRAIVDLQNRLNMATMQASQTAQTATLLADNAAQTRTLNPAPIPAYVVANPQCNVPNWANGNAWNFG